MIWSLIIITPQQPPFYAAARPAILWPISERTWKTHVDQRTPSFWLPRGLRNPTAHPIHPHNLQQRNGGQGAVKNLIGHEFQPKNQECLKELFGLLYQTKVTNWTPFFSPPY